MIINTIYNQDALTGLKTLPNQSVNCCVTSPPYWGLRDYGTAEWEGGDKDCEHIQKNQKHGGEAARPYQDEVIFQYKDVCKKCGAIRKDKQLGLEKTPEEYVEKMVEVFREVRRVLKDDGTLWLNLGDSFWSDTLSRKDPVESMWGNRPASNLTDGRDNIPIQNSRGGLGKRPKGLKPKDLVGIPWMVSKALQSPYYTGEIKDEKNRVWLAAMIDAEGTINGFYHKRKDDGSDRTGIHICITNSNEDIIEKAFEIFPSASKHEHTKNYKGHLGEKQCWRWHVFSIDGKRRILEEIYPYLIAKKKQAIVAWNFLKYQEKAKYYGKTSQKDDIIKLRKEIVKLLSKLNHGKDVDLPDWMKEPPSLYEPGWYLRSDIIWHKRNPIPESVPDRPTKSHEYIFLLSKSQKYYYDADAIAENAVTNENRPNGIVRNREYGYDSKLNKLRGHKNLQDNGQANHSMHKRRAKGEKDKVYKKKNKRSVWTVNTKPYKEAHFATFPEKLIVDCIKAGCPEGGIVLDPFMGAGTTALVARKLSRDYLGYELSKEHSQRAKNRIIKELGFFA